MKYYGSVVSYSNSKLIFRSRKLINLAKGLSPTNVRVGGTAADRLTFDPSKKTVNEANSYPLDDDGSIPFLRKFYMSGSVVFMKILYVM